MLVALTRYMFFQPVLSPFYICSSNINQRHNIQSVITADFSLTTYVMILHLMRKAGRVAEYHFRMHTMIFLGRDGEGKKEACTSTSSDCLVCRPRTLCYVITDRERVYLSFPKTTTRFL